MSFYDRIRELKEVCDFGGSSMMACSSWYAYWYKMSMNIKTLVYIKADIECTIIYQIWKIFFSIPLINLISFWVKLYIIIIYCIILCNYIIISYILLTLSLKMFSLESFSFYSFLFYWIRKCIDSLSFSKWLCDTTKQDAKINAYK